MKVPAEKPAVGSGCAHVNYVAQKHSLAVVDTPLETTAQPASRIWTPDSMEAEVFG